MILTVLSEAINADGLSTSRLRGPHLARLELIGRFHKEEKAIHNLLDRMKLGDTADLVINYILRFYAKPCCYNDIVQYLWLLDDDGKEELIDGLNEFIDSVIHQREQAGEDSVPSLTSVTQETLGTILLTACSITLSGLLSCSRSDRLSGACVKEEICGNESPNRQQLAGTALAQLAAAILWNEWKVHDDWQSFYELILLLEWTSNEYPTDPFCKLVLCRAYAHIGCMYRLVALTRSLDIKSVQRDTLGYIMFPMPELCGRFNVGIVHYTEMVEVYEQAEKEFVASNEMHRYLSALFAIENINEAVNTLHGNDDTIEWDSLCDNRDLGVVPSFERNTKQELDDLRKSTQAEFVDLTRLRHYISQALGSAGGANGAGIDELGADLTLLRLYLRYCRESYSLDIPYSRVMQSPSAVYLGHFVHGGFVDPIVDLLQSVLDLGGSKKAGEIRPSTTLSVLPTVEHMENQWTAMLPPFEPKITPFFIQDEIITCSRALQSLAACQLLIKILEKCGSCRFPENASKKGKSTVPAKNDFTTHCEALQAALRNSALRLKLRLDEMEYVLKENSYNLMPKIGTDWNVEVLFFVVLAIPDFTREVQALLISKLGEKVFVIASIFFLLYEIWTVSRRPLKS
uniref:Nuclear pore complex protein n=1 Tax=Angiostrongylus cantonensis TaxID=6313 RepID=A0A158P8B3_ANGCA